MIDYRTLSVRIEWLHDNRYKAIVCGPDGDGQSEFEMPFDERQLDALATVVSRPRSARRRIESDESAQARAFGQRTFELVFTGTARDVLSTAFAQARRENHGLRLMFQLDGAGRLRNVPWELLCESTKFVSTSSYSPILRYVDLPARPQPLKVRAPLRILGMVSSPGDMPALDTERERDQLVEACRSLTDQGLLEIEWVPEATLGGLLRCLNDGDYHVFHFLGHGDFDEEAEDGVLLFEARAGRSQRVTGVDLGTILADQHTLRLAVINACEGARVAPDSNGVASSLMRYGLPAVIAMQFEISDEAAIAFAEHFYGSIARGQPIDTALADARRGMFADGHGLEWATPVLFTSVDDSHLFDIGSAAPDDDLGRPSLPRSWATICAAVATALGVVLGALAVAGLFSGGGLSFGKPIKVEHDPVALAVSPDRVWMTNRKSNMVTAIDSHTGKAGKPLRIEGEPNGIAVDSRGYVWVVSVGNGLVTVFNPNSHPHPDSTVRSFHVEGKPNAIAFKFGKAWVTNEEGTVLEISESAVVHGGELRPNPIHVGGKLTGVAAGPRWVWVASFGAAASRVIGIRPGGETVEIPLGRSVSGVAVESRYGAERAVWVTNPSEQSVERIVVGADGAAARYQSATVGEEPQGLAVAANGVWVANKESGSVDLITVAGSRLIRAREVNPGGEPNAVAVGPDAVWVADVKESSVTPFALS
jgi:streptogramin lyase